jgi:fluoride exporter
MAYVLIFVLGGLGACVRFGIQSLWPAVGLSWATLAINSVGSFGLGVLIAKGSTWGLHSIWVTAIAAGFFGGLTTYSGFALELVKAFEARQLLAAGIYLVSQNLLALVGCYFGYHWVRLMS